MRINTLRAPFARKLSSTNPSFYYSWQTMSVNGCCFRILLANLRAPTCARKIVVANMHFFFSVDWYIESNNEIIQLIFLLTIWRKYHKHLNYQIDKCVKLTIHGYFLKLQILKLLFTEYQTTRINYKMKTHFLLNWIDEALKYWITEFRMCIWIRMLAQLH